MAEQVSYEVNASEQPSIDANKYLSVNTSNYTKNKLMANNNKNDESSNDDETHQYYSAKNDQKQERKDRQGKQIRKGSKSHKITFKDEVNVEQEFFVNQSSLGNEQQEGDVEHSDGECSENEQDLRPSIQYKRQKLNKRREALHDIIIVESYKEYNAQNPQWYSNQCCSIL